MQRRPPRSTLTDPLFPYTTLFRSQEDRNEASTKVLASPTVRARAKALGVDLSMVHSQGERIRHADLDAYLFYGKGEGYRAPGTSPVRPDEQVKVVGLRRRIAENMAASKRHIPHFTYEIGSASCRDRVCQYV